MRLNDLGQNRDDIHRAQARAVVGSDNIWHILSDETHVLLNRIAAEGNWIVFDVRNRHGSPALGAKITIRMDGKPRVSVARAAYSYCSSNDPRVHFGLGEISTVSDVRLTWPDGTDQSFGDFAAGAIHELRQE